MREIKCPSCGKNFKIDPSNFDQLLTQIKNEEFNKQIEERLHPVSYTHLTLPTMS